MRETRHVVRAKSQRWTFEVTKRVPLEGETDARRGFTTVPDGVLECDFEVEVDVERLVRAIGRRAAFSSKGISKLQGGAVVVRALSRTKKE
jgi:hypothetical protein